jgi:lysophospholipase L1-like esterase
VARSSLLPALPALMLLVGGALAGEGEGAVSQCSKAKARVAVRPESPPLDVPRVKGIRLDGRLDDWPAATRIHRVAFVASAPEHESAVHVGWSPEGLYLAVRAAASGLTGGAGKNFWQWSNIELFADASGKAHRGWPASSHQFWLMPVREGGKWRAQAGEWKRGDAVGATLYDDRRCKTAIRVEAGAYTMEMLIPTAALGSAPAAGKSWRAALAAQTTRPNRPMATLAWPRAKRDGILDGSRYWGELRFVGAAAAASRWEKAIQAFEAQDRRSPPPKGPIVFVGSSSIRGWNTKRYFPKLRTIQRGFGGSDVSDSLHFAHRIVTNYQPRVVVMYAGDNDIARGKTPQRVLADFKAFVAEVHARLPRTRIVYIASKPSIRRWKLVGRMRQANRLIEQFTRTDKRLRFVDIDKPMIGPDGRPRKELFKKDGLHLSHEGYVLWTRLVQPHVAPQQDAPAK